MLDELLHRGLHGSRDESSADIARGDIAIVLRRQQKQDAAQPLFEASVAFRTARYGAADPQTLRARHGLGNCLMDNRDYVAARVEFEAAASGLETARGPGHEWTLAVRSGIAALCSKTGDFEGAVVAYEQIAATHSEVRGAGHWRTLHTQAKLAHNLVKLGRVSEAVPMLEAAVPALRAQVGVASHTAFVEQVLEEARRATGELEA